MFPFGVEPGAATASGNGGRDDRGPDTMSRLLLHGARHHDRDAVFLHWGQGRKGWGWQETPDWRADRATIRAGLVLRQRLEVGEGEAVALWLPLGPEWAAVERAAWCLGAITVPIPPDWPLTRVAEVLDDAGPTVLFASALTDLEGLKATGDLPESVVASVVLRAPAEQGDDWLSHDAFIEYGGILDTPERASMLRTSAREQSPGRTVTWEYPDAPGGGRREIDDATLVRAATTVAGRFPPAKGKVQLLAAARPDLLNRTLLFAGWADGLTTTAFALSRAARERAGELYPDVLLGPGDAVSELLSSLPEGPPERKETSGGVFLRLGLGGGGRGDDPKRSNGGRNSSRGVDVIVTDGSRPAGAGPSRRVRFLDASELEGELGDEGR